MKKQFQIKPIASAVMLGMLSTQLMSQEASDGSPSLVMEEVVVSARSYRESLKKAIDMKRDAIVVSDAIVASDIASFPDQNLAEALQRVPGVAIERDHGLGLTVNIRSLGSQFTHTTINGISASSGNSGREVQFDVFASELMQSANVIKSMTAENDEGGVSGTVALRTARPFDYDGDKIALSLEGAYNTLSEETDPRYAGLISRTFADDKIGVLFSYAAEDRTHRSDSTQGRSWVPLTAVDDDTIPADIDGANTYFQRRTKTRVWGFEEEKWGATAAIQFRPTESLELGADLLLSNFIRHGTNYNVGADIGRGQSVVESLDVVNGSVRSGSFSNVRFDAHIRDDIWETDYQQIDLYADWEVGEWNIKGLLGYSESERQYGSPDTAHFLWRQTASVDYHVDGKYVVYSSPDFDIANDVSGYQYVQTTQFDDNTVDDKTLLKMDVSRVIDHSLVSLVKFGFKYSEQTRDVRSSRRNYNASADGSVTYAGASMADIDLVYASDFFSGGDLFSQGNPPAGVPTDIIMPDVNAAFAAYVDPNIALEERIGSRYYVNEDIFAVYASSELTFDIGAFPALMDIGVRYVSTDQLSGGNREEDGQVATNEVSNDYGEWLPMLNMRVDLTEDLLLRFAAGKALTRATLGDLSARFSVDDERGRISAGNPNLKPFTTEQVDLTLEYYYGEESLLAIAVFQKDLDTFIVSSPSGTMIEYNGLTYEFRSKENAEGASITGLEFSFQTPFTFLPSPFDGFGMNFNYTYLDSELEQVDDAGDSFGIPKLSENSYNMTLYYEKYGFDARLAYNYRDEYVLEVRNGFPLKIDALGQFDFSAGYQVNDNIKLTLKAINITNEEEYQFMGSTDQPDVLRQLGRRISAGVRVTF
jgi:iron complex outermembrane recepter protein